MAIRSETYQDAVDRCFRLVALTPCRVVKESFRDGTIVVKLPKYAQSLYGRQGGEGAIQCDSSVGLRRPHRAHHFKCEYRGELHCKPERQRRIVLGYFFNASGSRTLTASYGGDVNDNASVSAAVTQTVN